jgi:hypothetical protein
MQDSTIVIILLLVGLALVLFFLSSYAYAPVIHKVKLNDSMSMDDDMGWSHTKRFKINYAKIYPCSTRSQTMFEPMVCRF